MTAAPRARSYLIAFGVIGLLPCSGLAQAPESLPTPTPQPTVQLLRYEEDWSSLCKSTTPLTGLDRIKYIPLGKNCGTSYLSLGGEFRGTFERIQNDNWGATPYPTNTFELQRYQLHLDAHITPYARLFLQLESGLEQDRLGGARPIDEKHLDFLNAFVELRTSTAHVAPTLRVGRQEFNFGSGRLVSVREGPNVRQSFYAFRVDEALASWKLTGLAARPAADNSGYFDNVPVHTTQFWGLFAEYSHKQRATHIADLYYFGLDRKSATFNRGTAREVRQTIGGRIALQPDTSAQARMVEPHFDLEAIYQFGSFGSTSIRAWTVATETGFLFPHIRYTPRLGARADISSGDGGHRALGTFNPLFPIGNYFGILADTGLGPINFYDVHPDLRLAFPHKVSFDADWFFWWRQNTADGLYNVPGNLLFSGGTSSARYVGQRPGIELRWQFTSHAYIQADYGVFFARTFLRQSGHEHNLDYTSLWLGYKF